MSLPVSVQMFSVRDQFAQNPIETLKKIKACGYDYIETAGLADMDPRYFKGVCDAIGLKVKTAHVFYEGLAEDAKKVVNMYKELGCKYIAIAYLGVDHLPGGAEFEKGIKRLEYFSKVALDAGMQLLYHNHGHELDIVNGDYLLDTVINCIPSKMMLSEFDTGWAQIANVDPVKYIKNHKGMIPAVHIKDYAPESVDRPITCPAGTGVLDVKGIALAAVECGAEWIVVEQDDPYGEMDYFEGLAIARSNLKKLGF